MYEKIIEITELISTILFKIQLSLISIKLTLSKKLHFQKSFLPSTENLLAAVLPAYFFHMTNIHFFPPFQEITYLSIEKVGEKQKRQTFFSNQPPQESNTNTLAWGYNSTAA